MVITLKKRQNGRIRKRKYVRVFKGRKQEGGTVNDRGMAGGGEESGGRGNRQWGGSQV